MDISDSPAKGRSFCKIMFSEVCLHDKIMIPGKFVRKYGKELHVRVYLKVPGAGGAVWNVDLLRDDDKVWLRNGWPEFARFYSLSFGHFLVFKYQENSHFDVLICDKSGTEIDYSLVSREPHMDEQGNLDLRQFTQVRKRAMNNIDELKACKKTRVNSACTEACHFGECQMRKLQKLHLTKLSGQLEVTMDDNIQPLDMIKPNKTKDNLNNTQRQGELHLGGSTADEGKAKALALAKVCRSKNPTFILTILPSHIGRRGQVVHINILKRLKFIHQDIKKAFGRRYMGRKQNFKVCLQVERRTWQVTFYPDRYRFGGGWPKFADGNSLSLGDVCVFELLNRAQMLLKVFIHRAAKC